MRKKYADVISFEKRSLIERGLPKDSYFEITFIDNSTRSEINTSWKVMSQEEVILHGDKKKVALVCMYPVKKIKVFHKGLMSEIVTEKGEQIYQSIKSSTTYSDTAGMETKIVGRIIGKVKDGIVIEEKFLSEFENEVFGLRF